MGLPVEFLSPAAPEGADEPTVLATAAWGQVARLFLSQQTRREDVAAELGLGFGDLVSLFHLQPAAGIAQRDLAEQWSCDPSWVTTRIDHLEELGLVERRVSPTDRRVKEVWLTPAGESSRSQGMAGFGTPPAVLTDLSITDLRHLARILAKLDLPDPGATAIPPPA